MKKQLLFLPLVGILTSGCAVGNQHNYHLIDPTFQVSTKQLVAVGVQDQRSYILSNDKNAEFVGLQRGGFGNPFDVTTESGNPLSVDFAAVVASGLQTKGVTTHTVNLMPNASRQEALQRLLEGSPAKAIFITLLEWKSDTYQNTALIYHVTLEVFDKAGNSLAQSEIQGRDDLRGSFWNPPNHARAVLPTAYKQKLESLVNDPSVVKALH